MPLSVDQKPHFALDLDWEFVSCSFKVPQDHGARLAVSGQVLWQEKGFPRRNPG